MSGKDVEIADLRSALEVFYGGLDVVALSNQASLRLLPVPSVDPNERNFQGAGFPYIGRSWFPELISFLRGLMQPPAEQQFPFRISEDDKKRMRLAPMFGVSPQSAYIIGTPGEGKSFGIAVAAGHFLITADFRVVYVSAICLIDDFDNVLMRALRLTFVNDVISLREAEGNPMAWLLKQEKALIVVDDFNRLDEDRTGGEVGSREERMRVKALLRKLSRTHVVVYCGSCSSKIRLPLTRTTHDPYFVIAGGYNEAEFATFVESYEFHKDPKVVLEKCGRNPRLLRYYSESEDKVEEELKLLEAGLEAFMLGLDSLKYSHFVKQLAGGLATDLPDAMDSRCFYVPRGENQLAAICDRLRATANSFLIREEIVRAKLQEAHIRAFVQVVTLDGGKNMSRIGWNAEEATLLIFGSRQVSIGLGELTWHFTAETVAGFPEGIETASLEVDTRSILHCPVRFNCEAVDGIIEGVVNGKKVVAGLQISVDLDPQVSHDTSMLKFLTMVHDKGYDILVLIWVGHFPGNFGVQEIEVKLEDAQKVVKVIEVTLSFSQVHPMLRPIDVVLNNVRGRQLKEEDRVCCEAKMTEGNACVLTVKKMAGDLCHVHYRKRQRDLTKQIEIEDPVKEILSEIKL